jgi:cell shape-determining protein MreC
MNNLVQVLEDRVLIIALVIIIPYIIISSLIIFYLRDVQTFKEVTAIYAGWVGSVIGYFFGSRQVDKLVDKIDGLTRLSETRLKELEDEKRKYREKRSQYENAIEDISRRAEQQEELINKVSEILKGKTGE